MLLRIVALKYNLCLNSREFRNFLGAGKVLTFVFIDLSTIGSES